MPCAALPEMGVLVEGEVMGFMFRCKTSRGRLVGAPGVPARSHCNVNLEGDDSRGDPYALSAVFPGACHAPHEGSIY